jgi:DNA-binding CsgD family transcriptional regulator
MTGNEGEGGEGALSVRFAEVFRRITPKQQQVLRFVAENHTSKEIAFELGISESAVNQRIESIRARTGYPARAELGRAFRQFTASEEACNPLTAKIPQVPAGVPLRQQWGQDDAEYAFDLADALPYEVKAPWQAEREIRVVPGMLDGAQPALNRTVAMIAIAGGMLAVAMIGLGVAQALTTVF